MTRTTRVSEEVAERIAAAMRSGEFPEGARLPSERDLSTRFGVSRVSVREALLALQARSLVTLRDRARAKVTAPDARALLSSVAGSARSLLARPSGVSDFQEARILLECGLARYAARYASPKEVERLGAALIANRQAIGDVDRFVATDMAFHAVLAEIPRNMIFTALNAALAEWLLEQRRIGLRPRGAERRAYRHHQAVFEAVAAGSPERADAAMANHLTIGARIIDRQQQR